MQIKEILRYSLWAILAILFFYGMFILHNDMLICFLGILAWFFAIIFIIDLNENY